MLKLRLSDDTNNKQLAVLSCEEFDELCYHIDKQVTALIQFSCKVFLSHYIYLYQYICYGSDIHTKGWHNFKLGG